MKSLLVIFFYASTTLANEEFTKANNLFTSTVYKEISWRETDNFLVSPFSAETVLALTLSGCKGQTAQELQNALHLPDVKAFEEDIRTLLPQLKSSRSYTLQIANKMYVKNDFIINNYFRKLATEIFGAESESIDFGRQAKAAKVMNSWVERKTQNRIQNLINSDILDNYTRVVLINALYFKAEWLSPFNTDGTTKIDFYKTSQHILKVNAMQIENERHFSYYESRDLSAKFLEMPFKGGDATMTFVLPNEREGLARLEREIGRVFVPQKFTLERVNVVLPKFKIESRIDLKSILKYLGVNLVFKDFEADLSGIAGRKGDLVLSEVIQKSFIDVNEGGVEAAAATFGAIGVPRMGFFDTPKEFRADHPFIFYIKIKGVIIFVGRVTEPTH